MGMLRVAAAPTAVVEVGAMEVGALPAPFYLRKAAQRTAAPGRSTTCLHSAEAVPVALEWGGATQPLILLLPPLGGSNSSSGGGAGSVGEAGGKLLIQKLVGGGGPGSDACG